MSGFSAKAVDRVEQALEMSMAIDRKQREHELAIEQLVVGTVSVSDWLPSISILFAKSVVTIDKQQEYSMRLFAV